jgi:MFS family permease
VSAAVHPIQTLIRERPMSLYQVLVVALCVFINAIDGFDILALSFASPVIVREWGLTPEQTGFVFGANLAGIGIGAFVWSFVADLVGRRPVIILGTLFMSVGMIATATVDGLNGLALCRLVTGLGIGAMVSTAGTLAIEYSAARWRTVSVALVVLGYPVGGAVGGLATSWLMAHYGWRPIFLFGGSLTRINRYAARLALPVLEVLPPPGARVGAVGQFVELWRPAHRRASLTLCVLYPLYMFTFYFFISWSTKMATERGLSDAAAVGMSSLISLSGIAGGVVFGLVAARVRLTRLVATLAVLMSLGIVAFGVLPATPGVLNLAALLQGFIMWGTSATIYSVIALSYPVRVRASGIGLVVTIGRAGSALGPLCAGLLRGAGYEWSFVALVLAIPAVLAAVLITTLRPDSHTTPRPVAPGTRF